MKKKCPVIDMAKTGNNIKNIMLLKGFTVKDVQEFLELGTPQSIYHWFEGRNLPTVDNLYALSELFNMPVDAILVGSRKNQNMYSNILNRWLVAYYEKFNLLKAG